jgi:hypothetical protein
MRSFEFVPHPLHGPQRGLFCYLSPQFLGMASVGTVRGFSFTYLFCGFWHLPKRYVLLGRTLIPDSGRFKIRNWAREGRTGTALTPAPVGHFHGLHSHEATKWGERENRLRRMDRLTASDTAHKYNYPLPSPCTALGTKYISRSALCHRMDFYRIPSYASETSCTKYVLTFYASKRLVTGALFFTPPRA